MKMRGIGVAVIVASVGSTVWGQSLPTDPAIVSGQLENGLRYMVRQNAVPPGRAVMWIHLDTGSLNETDPQRGLAHYLEHMAFNGSANFPPGSLVPYFQSLGMTFGRDQNAFTSFDQTTYQLTLPNTDPQTLTKGLTFFADVTGRLSLLPEEIDKERQIIQEERRRGLSGRQRVSFHVLERLAPGSLYGERITIGKEETINSVTQKDFLDYYGRYYVASNATVMVVGDTDPAKVVELIRTAFGDLPARPKPVPQALNVRAYTESFAIVASDPEVRSEQVQIVRLEPARPPVTTVEQFRDDLVAGLGTSALNRRLSDKQAAGTTSYSNAFLSMGSDSQAIYTVEFSGRAKPGKWKETLGEVAMEWQRARRFGVTAHELEIVKKEMLSGAERAVETEATTPSSARIARMNAAVADDEPVMSPAQRLELLTRHLPSISLGEVNKRLSAELDPKAVAFIATLPSEASVPTESDLLAMGTKAMSVEPQREAETSRAGTLMAKLPEAGTVGESSEHTGTKVWSGWLSNNVLVHHRFMDERKNQVTVSIDLIGGEMLETAKNRGITSAAALAFSRPATRQLTSTDINDLMAGKKVSVRGGGFGGFGGGGGGRRGGGGGGGNTDSISLNISGSPEELETGFQLAHLLLTEPRIEKAAFDQYKTGAVQSLEESLKNPMASGMRAAAGVLYPEGEARLQPLTIEQINALDLDSAQAWLDRLIKESPIEIVVVGDMPREKIMGLVARYLGSLPSRPRVSEKTYAELRAVARPAGPRSVEKAVTSSTEQAFVMSGFYGADQKNVGDARALDLAARILSTRMVKEVREEAQLVYSIGASSRAASAYPGFGLFSAAAPTDPAKVKPLTEKLRSMYDAFAKSGPTEDEMTVVRKQFANTQDEERRDPSFWSRRLQSLAFRGASLDDLANEPDAMQSISADQVRETFRKYWKPENAIGVVVSPTKP